MFIEQLIKKERRKHDFEFVEEKGCSMRELMFSECTIEIF
jgi:hypothetical protein